MILYAQCTNPECKEFIEIKEITLPQVNESMVFMPLEVICTSCTKACWHTLSKLRVDIERKRIAQERVR